MQKASRQNLTVISVGLLFVVVLQKPIFAEEDKKVDTSAKLKSAVEVVVEKSPDQAKKLIEKQLETKKETLVKQETVQTDIKRIPVVEVKEKQLEMKANSSEQLKEKIDTKSAEKALDEKQGNADDSTK